MTTWRVIELGELVDAGKADIRTGPFGTQLRAADYTTDGVPVINVRNLGYGFLRTADIERVDWAVQKRLSGHLLVQGDLVFGRKGAVDRHVLVTDKEAGWMQGSDCIRLRLAADSPISPEFLSKALLTPTHMSWMEAQCSHGATMASLNQEILRRIVVRAPHRSEQDKISAALSTFDGLIGINKRRIEVIEDLARSLYREWFVRFRFPGHESVELVDSELGLIPEEWKVEPVGQVLNLVGGGTPSKKEASYWEGGSIPWYTPSDLTKTRSRFAPESGLRITPEGLAKSSARLFPAGSVMMTSRATLGVLAIAADDSTCNQGFIVIPPNERLGAHYVFEWLDDHRIDLELIATGATFKEIAKGALKRFPLLVPAVSVERWYHSLVDPMASEIRILEQQNGALAKARDLILPRLVTGRFDISDIDLRDQLPVDAA